MPRSDRSLGFLMLFYSPGKTTQGKARVYFLPEPQRLNVARGKPKGSLVSL